MNNYARTTLHQLQLSLHLGWTEEEQLQKQPVMLDIDIIFPEPPLACITDRLEDTYCYAVLARHIQTKIASRSFCLLEHVAHEIYQLVKSSFSPTLSVNITVTKKPVISSVIAGVSFCYGDKYNSP
jgi:dihydroneopterin aldolase